MTPESLTEFDIRRQNYQLEILYFKWELRCRPGTSYRLHLSRDYRRKADVGPRTSHVSLDQTINQHDAASHGDVPPSIEQSANVRVDAVADTEYCLALLIRTATRGEAGCPYLSVSLDSVSYGERYARFFPDDV